MKKNPPPRKLREHPNLDQLKRQAKELLEAFVAGCKCRRDATSALTIATERGYDEIVAIIKEAEQRRRSTVVYRPRAAAANLEGTAPEALTGTVALISRASAWCWSVAIQTSAEDHKTRGGSV